MVWLVSQYPVKFYIGSFSFKPGTKKCFSIGIFLLKVGHKQVVVRSGCNYIFNLADRIDLLFYTIVYFTWIVNK